MSYITKKHLSRRTVLKGMGVTVALPFLDAMVPAAHACTRRPRPACRRRKPRLVAIEMVHGSAGSTAIGSQKNLWSPAATGARLRSVAEQPGAARALPRLPDDRQQHRRAERRGVARRPRSAAITSGRARCS